MSRSRSKKPERKSVPRPSAKERILDAADRLFYLHGFRAVGVDTIIAEAGIAKMTLYRHFPSKDELIAACLSRTHDRLWTLLTAIPAGMSDPVDRIRNLVRIVQTIATGPRCRGCIFQVAAAEFADGDSPVRKVAVLHKEKISSLLEALAAEAGYQDPPAIAGSISLLVDGAWVMARVFGAGSPARHLTVAVDAVLAGERTQAGTSRTNLRI